MQSAPLLLYSFQSVWVNTLSEFASNICESVILMSLNFCPGEHNGNGIEHEAPLNAYACFTFFLTANHACLCILKVCAAGFSIFCRVATYFRIMYIKMQRREATFTLSFLLAFPVQVKVKRSHLLKAPPGTIAIPNFLKYFNKTVPN